VHILARNSTVLVAATMSEVSHKHHDHIVLYFRFIQNS